MDIKSKIVLFPDKRLFAPTKEVRIFDKELGEILDEMKEVMTALNGLGIASNQIGYTASIFLLKEEKSGDIKEIINPKVLSVKGNQVYSEGCLSAPGIFVPTNRPQEVHFTYQDRYGIIKEAVVEGLEAIIFSHEFEHLNGGYFIHNAVSRQQKRNAQRLIHKQI
jgi:peptide deformylase